MRFLPLTAQLTLAAAEASARLSFDVEDAARGRSRTRAERPLVEAVDGFSGEPRPRTASPPLPSRFSDGRVLSIAVSACDCCNPSPKPAASLSRPPLARRGHASQPPCHGDDLAEMSGPGDLGKGQGGNVCARHRALRERRGGSGRLAGSATTLLPTQAVLRPRKALRLALVVPESSSFVALGWSWLSSDPSPERATNL